MKNIWGLVLVVVAIPLCFVYLERPENLPNPHEKKAAKEQEVFADKNKEVPVSKTNYGTNNDPSRDSLPFARDVQAVLNLSLPMETRLNTWLTLHRKMPLSIPALVSIAISPNTAKPSADEHLIEGVLYRKEEGLRIVALQSLEHAVLENLAPLNILYTVAESAQSTTLKEVASKMYEFAQNGESYSATAEAAIMKESIPE